MYITLCERKGSFLPRFRKLSSETIQTDSNGFKPRAARRTTKTRKEERLLSPLRSLLPSSSVLPQFFSQKKITFFWRKTKKKREEENQFLMGETNWVREQFFTFWVFSHQTGLFCTNRNALYTNKKHYHEVFTNASIIINE